MLIVSLYAPNGNPNSGPKFGYKLAWMERLIAHAADLRATGAPVALAGDFNVVPTDLDIYKTKSWDRNALLQPGSRASYRRLLAQGWTDAVRALRPEEPMYTFWDYKVKRWERDGGLRIDHILVSPALTDQLEDVGVDRDARGREGASDHAPVWVKLREAPLRASSRRALSPRSSKEEGGEAAEPAGGGAAERGSAPLLALDGDNFAHRAHHAVPKTIRRADGKGAGAIVGFANTLMHFHDTERPRAVIVGWDSLEAPNWRCDLFPSYQSGHNPKQLRLDLRKNYSTDKATVCALRRRNPKVVVQMRPFSPCKHQENCEQCLGNHYRVSAEAVGDGFGYVCCA